MPSLTTKTAHAEQIIDHIHQNSLSVEWVLETHVYADHLTASRYLKKIRSQNRNEQKDYHCAGNV